MARVKIILDIAKMARHPATLMGQIAQRACVGDAEVISIALNREDDTAELVVDSDCCDETEGVWDLLHALEDGKELKIKAGSKTTRMVNVNKPRGGK